MTNETNVMIHINGDIEIEGLGIFKDTNCVEIEILKLLFSSLVMASNRKDIRQINERLIKYIEENPSAKELFTDVSEDDKVN